MHLTYDSSNIFNSCWSVFSISVLKEKNLRKIYTILKKKKIRVDFYKIFKINFKRRFDLWCSKNKPNEVPEHNWNNFYTKVLHYVKLLHTSPKKSCDKICKFNFFCQSFFFLMYLINVILSSKYFHYVIQSHKLLCFLLFSFFAFINLWLI